MKRLQGPTQCPLCARRDVVKALHLHDGRVALFVATHDDCDGAESPWSVGYVGDELLRPMTPNAYGAYMDDLLRFADSEGVS